MYNVEVNQMLYCQQLGRGVNDQQLQIKDIFYIYLDKESHTVGGSLRRQCLSGRLESQNNFWLILLIRRATIIEEFEYERK